MTEKPKTVLELFEGHPERWSKGAYARMRGAATSVLIEESNPEACSYCLHGAVYYVYGRTPDLFHDTDESRAALIKLERALQKRGFFGNTINFNDDLGRTFEDVVALVREAGV